MSESLRMLVLAVLVAGILVFDPRSGYSGGRPKHILVVAGALTAGVMLLSCGRSSRPNPLRWPVAALLVAAALATVTSEHRRTAFYGFAGSYDGLLATVSFAVLFVASGRAFSRDSVLGAVRTLWFGAGTAVLLFGAAQLVDRLVSPDSGWDWARPDTSPWTIGSTLGNPNHLGGLLAMLLPLAAVLAVATRGRERTLVLVGAALAVAELAVTSSRGAWAAAVVATAFLAALFRRQLRRHYRQLVFASGAIVAVTGLVFAILGPANVTKLRPQDLAKIGPGTTLDLRLEVWSTAWRITLDHPVLGVGPDVFPVVFPAYESERFMLLYGPFTIANGAHNIFLNTLANLGAAGLAAFVALLVAAGTWLARAWRGLDDGSRLLAGGLSAALLAYVVQACLNTQTVPLTLGFWVLLGWLVALSSPSAKEHEGCHEGCAEERS